MNTYFKQSLVQVQSEEFIADFKVTIRFIIKIIKVIFLLLTGVFLLVKSFYLKSGRQDIVAETTVCNNLDNSLTLVEGDRTTSEDIILVDDTLDNLVNEGAVYLPVEEDREITVTESAIVELTNSESAEVSRQSQLKSMKAAELRQLCAGYSISYKNKSQAVVAILDKEESMVKELTHNESATAELSNEQLSVELSDNNLSNV